MSKITKCRNCGKEFVRGTKKKSIGNKSLRRGKQNYMYCCPDCYWQYHLKDILKKNK